MAVVGMVLMAVVIMVVVTLLTAGMAQVEVVLKWHGKSKKP